MIPRIQTGSSFKGAGLYYLHDKRADGEQVRETKERVAWTYAINTLENEPEAVLAEMRHTAFDQFLLKMESGNRIDGRPTEKLVMTVALAWAPTEKPTREDMIEAGHSFLQHMKWEEHQVLFVAHNDTKHPHVHLIINRVHPETGMTQDAAWTKHRSQQWALKYERERGHVYCEAREIKYGRDGERAPSGMTQREWQLWQEISKENAFDPDYRRMLEAGEWAVLKDAQRDARVNFWKETGEQRKELRTELREAVRWEYAREWQEYAKVKGQRDLAAKLYDREARHAIRELRRQRGPQRAPRGNQSKEIAVVRGPDGRTYVKRRTTESRGIEQIKERQKAYHARQREELWQLRKDIIDRQKTRFEELARPALERLGDDRSQSYKALLSLQRGGKADLREDQRHGERRHDVLGDYKQPVPQPTPLTREQSDAYLKKALRTSSRQQQFDRAGREAADADHGRSQTRGRDPQVPNKVTPERMQETKNKNLTREARIKARTEYHLQKRAADRARDRDGGRDR